jgi:hypothetical protein
MPVLERRLALLEAGSLQQVSLRGHPKLPFYGGGSYPPGTWSYLKFPVVTALPPQDRHREDVWADEFRRQRTVRVKSVELSLEVAHVYGVKMSLLLHKAPVKEGVRVQTDAKGVPKFFELGIADEEGRRRLMDLDETGVARDRNSAYVLTAEDAEGSEGTRRYRPATSDGRLYGCDLAPMRDVALGLAEWSVDGGKRTRCGSAVNLRLAPCAAGRGVLVSQNVYVKWTLDEMVEFLVDECGQPLDGMMFQGVVELSPCAAFLGSENCEKFEAGRVDGCLLNVSFAS